MAMDGKRRATRLSARRYWRANEPRAHAVHARAEARSSENGVSGPPDRRAIKAAKSAKGRYSRVFRYEDRVFQEGDLIKRKEVTANKAVKAAEKTKLATADNEPVPKQKTLDSAERTAKP
jgi:hypothetical protein